MRLDGPDALAAFFGCWFYILMINAGSAEGLALWTAAGVTTMVRLVAWRYDWSIK